MPATVVIPVDERLDSLKAFLHVHVALQIDVLVLERAPEPLYIHVVQRAALAVHRQLRRATFVLEVLRELFRSVLPTPEEGVLLLEPLEEHETSYFAAAERIEIFFKVDSNIHTLLCSINIFTTAQKCKYYFGSVRLIRTFLQRLPKRCENDRLALLGYSV